MAGLEGTTLGPYKILSLLGAGGMGQVYRARDPRLDREVAIKVLSAALAQEEGYLERFRREARAVAQLNHPNIVPVYDYGEQNGTTYLVMPLIQGGTLRDLLTRRGALPLGEALPIIEQIAAALHYAHERGLVHRDVKPANILVGPDGRALLSDFGIVRVLSNDLGSTMTQTGAFIGSPEYAAPEMVLAQGIDHRVDIYALGMVVFQMLIGRVAFAGPTPVSLLMMHAQQPPPSPRSLNPAIPPAVDAAILKALAKAPADRYQSVAEFAAALRVGAGMAQTQAGTNQMPNVSDMATLRSALPPTVPVAPPPALTPIVPPAQTPPIWSATPAYTPPALPTFTTGLPASYDQTIPRTGVHSAPSSVAPVPPPPPRRRRRVALLVTLALVLIVAGGSTLAVGIAQGWFSSNKTASSPTATTSPTATATTAPTATATPLPTYFYMAHNFVVLTSDLQNGDTADKQLGISQGQYTQREGPKGDLYQFGEALFYGSQSSWATLIRDSNGKVAFVVLSDRFDTYQNAHRYFVRDLMLLPNPTTLSLEEEAAGGMVVGPGSKQGYQLFVRDRNIVFTIAAVPAENAQDFSAYFLSVAMAVQARGHQCHYYAPDPTQPGTLKPVQGSPQACN